MISTSHDDLAYDHIDGVILGFAVMLCLSLLLIGGTRSQRAYAIFLLPLLIFVIEVMRRRAAFAVLFVGLAVLFLLLFRLRPQLTWKILVPAVLFDRDVPRRILEQHEPNWPARARDSLADNP